MGLEDNLVAIFRPAAKVPVGAGLLVERDLVLTCAHVVKSALSLEGVQTESPSGNVEVKLHTSLHRGKAFIDSGSDAWSEPPATRQLGADLCLLRLECAYQSDAKPGRLTVFADLPHRKFRVAGYPKSWDVDYASGEIVGRDEHGLYMLRPEPTVLAQVSGQSSFLASRQRPPGIIYKGFSGSPVEVEGGIVGLLTEARERVSEATAYMIPVSAFPERVRKQARTPSEWWVEDWLTSKLPDIAKRFADHMAAEAIKPGSRPEELYLEVMVTERHLQKKPTFEGQPENQTDIKNTHFLDDVLVHARFPLLLIGEGGGGKTTSLLYSAVQAADRARVDAAAAVPIYVNLARFPNLTNLPDLHNAIAVSVHTDWKELSGSGLFKCRQVIFLFDSFNEIPELQQRTCMRLFQDFIQEQGDRHVYLMASRRIPLVEQLTRPPWNFKTFEVVRLTPDQVHGFLQKFKPSTLYERMPRRLRELAGNPFMLLAIVHVSAHNPNRSLPRNEGELYQGFVRGWMQREEDKRIHDPEYSYEYVKEPLLAYLAKRMTSAGQTSLAWTNDLHDEVRARLDETQKQMKIERRKAMPEDWTPDSCLGEIFGDGLLKRVNEQLHFVHQSVQEYFTGLYFRDTFPEALVDFTPKLLLEFVSTHGLAQVPNHRFTVPLLMMSGFGDSTKIVEALFPRNPILAAAVISSANHVDGSLLARLEQSWLDLLEQDDLGRIVACSCLALASMRSSRVIRHLVAMSLSADYKNSEAGLLALEKLNAGDATTQAVVEYVLKLPDDAYEGQKYHIEQGVKKLQSASMVNMLFVQWRASPPDSSARHRFEDLMAALDRSVLNKELQTIMTRASDPAVVADAQHASAEIASREPPGVFTPKVFKRFFDHLEKKYIDDKTEAVAKLKKADDRELAASLGSSDVAIRGAAATLIAGRRIQVADAILQSLLRVDPGWSQDDLIFALISLWGEQKAVAKLVAGSREKSWCVGTLNPHLACQLEQGELSEEVAAEIKRIGAGDAFYANQRKHWGRTSLTVVGNKADGETSTWLLSTPRSDPFTRLYQIRVLPEGLQFHDCNLAARAFEALSRIPGEASLAELQRAVQHDDPNVQRIAIEALAERGDQGLAARLTTQLGSMTSADVVVAAIDALGKLRAREAVSLVHDLLVTTETDVHPVWGCCPHAPDGWGEAIHRTLLRLNADGQIQQALDKALISQDPAPKVAALKEFSRWFEESRLSPERTATWRAPERSRQLVQLALSDPVQSVRAAATEAVKKSKSGFVEETLAEALSDNAVEVRVSAGEALVHIEVQQLYGRVAETMLQVAKTDQTQALRRRAGKVLTAIPNGVEPFYQSIQASGDPERALQLIDTVLEVIPEDANLFWWRGHALRSLGRLEQAADSYQRAFELEKRASVIPRALAQTFLDLGDFPRAIEAARRGVEIAPDDADSESILAWSAYKGGATQEAVAAARKAVDLDPVHSNAIWIVLLSHIRQGSLEESQSAFKHALRVRQLLSPGMDTSFLNTLVEELEDIRTDNAKLSGLMTEITDVLSKKAPCVRD